MQNQVEFWTIFKYGGCDTVCSKHKTFKAAKRAASHCEAQGGFKHRIAEVRWIDRENVQADIIRFS